MVLASLVGAPAHPSIFQAYKKLSYLSFYSLFSSSDSALLERFMPLVND